MASTSSSSSSPAFPERKGFKADADGQLYYSPYSELFGAMDQHLYKLPTTPEFLFSEEATFQRRSLGENIQYYTGCGYLGGAVAGGAKGLVDGVRQIESGDTAKLRVNRLLNSSGHTGRMMGNKIGIVGLMYAGMESGAWYLRKSDDLLNSVAAGLATGAFYKAAAGPRTAAIAGALGAMAAGGMVVGKQAAKRYLPL
ncbi:hypothetical protein SELMODRAFT_108321 [Selaginella moellendorffii]|uniref:Mitochondrial import inner membrane translocase subunit TIM23 n=1 Tax=Selaginella moellendorffii TaxID=88036 RepID=D8S3U8_SELML|nr:mitochondrial import inner membrane translocase subunit TIM23-2 [Selaginella moellendorffii]EFJ20647.1 hypothetical protein SELMODRAFT_108321 [Selaginella moellendorffii]|eukprot:XP_002977990.1 mitochondrial import inner membrane translocase subunit TIM23-2 [Selaginella moellendorffii]